MRARIHRGVATPPAVTVHKELILTAGEHRIRLRQIEIIKYIIYKGAHNV